MPQTTIVKDHKAPAITTAHLLLAMFVAFFAYPLAVCAADRDFPLDILVFKRVDVGGGPANSHIMHILQANDGRMIVTSSGYVDIYDGARFRHLAVPDSVEKALPGCDMPYTVYADNHDRVWFKQWGKLKCLNLRTERFITDIDSIYSHHGIKEKVLDVLCDENGSMWVRTRSALVSLDNPRRRIALADTLNTVHDLHIVGNRIYLFFNTCEIQCYDLNTLKLQYTCTPLSNGEGKGYSSQTSVVVSGGNRIYIFKSGSKGGVCYRFDTGNRSFKEIMRRDNGFHGVSLLPGRRIFIASRDCVWGISLADESITRYEQFNLQGELFGFRHFNWIYVDRQDGVWLCSYNDGIFYAHAANQQSYDADGIGGQPVPTVSPLNVMLVGMSINGERQKTGSGKLQESEAFVRDISLDYGDRNVIVEISALNYALPNSTLYYYKLVGDGDDADSREWSAATRENYMVDSNGLLILPLQNLDPGAYSLIVKAQCGKASATTTFRLNVAAPWWLTPIAFAVYLIVAVAVIVGLSSLMTLYSRRKMDRRRKEERLIMQIHSLIDRCNEYEKAIAETTGKDSKACSGDGSETCIAGDENETSIADETDDNQLSEADSEFLRRAIELVERNVSTSGYSVEQLSADLCMERSGLYKKMTAIMEKTPSAFIRSIRMQKAAGLLKTGKYTVSEVAMRTGFSSTSHFCRVFQSEYGRTPGEYIKMKFLFFCILSLGIFSCNVPKDNAPKDNVPKADTEYQTKSSTSSHNNKDSLYIELKQCRVSQGDSIVILYSIKNQTQWHYIYLSDEYWIERQVKGKWIRIQNDFGSILMGKEIPAYSCINDSTKIFLKTGHYKFCNTAYSDDARIGNKKIVMKAYFEVKSCKHSN